MLSRLFCCWALCGAVLLGPSAQATQIIRRTLPELAAGAELIFIGRCEAVSSHWNANHSLILTANRFRVLRVLKGSPGAMITLDELGGTVGNVATDAPGVPRYRAGEEVLLFVHRTELGRWETHGAVQGRFQVRRDQEGRPWVENDLYQGELAALRATRAATARVGSTEEAGAPLDLFASRLRALQMEAPRR
jgi:hypothetical protein